MEKKNIKSPRLEERRKSISQEVKDQVDAEFEIIKKNKILFDTVRRISEKPCEVEALIGTEITQEQYDDLPGCMCNSCMCRATLYLVNRITSNNEDHDS